MWPPKRQHPLPVKLTLHWSWGSTISFSGAFSVAESHRRVLIDVTPLEFRHIRSSPFFLQHFGGTQPLQMVPWFRSCQTICSQATSLGRKHSLIWVAFSVGADFESLVFIFILYDLKDFVSCTQLFPLHKTDYYKPKFEGRALALRTPDLGSTPGVPQGPLTSARSDP